MKRYNFDEIINRRNSGCLKWDSLEERWHRKDLISMWIADMDFRTPKFLMDALNKRNKHEVLGYACRPEEWYDAVIYWFKERYGWKIKKENIGFVPGIVVGICHALRCFTKPGDKVLIFPPVYYPFKNQIESAHCKTVNCKLILKDEEMEIDFADFKKKIKGCKAMILCNPHNPGGRVWKRSELEQIAEICAKNKVLVLSDEIHCDLTFPSGKRKEGSMRCGHIPFATVNKKAAERTITFHAPSKTFNCAGLGSSEWIATDKKLHDTFEAFLEGGEFCSGNVYTFIPDLVVYTKQGYDWLSQALDYMKGNIDYVSKFLKDNFTVETVKFSGKGKEWSSRVVTGKSQLISMIRPEASFLIFVDFRKLGLSQKELVDFISDDAHLALNDGVTFGPGGEGFMRMNIGCPRSVVEKAMQQIKRAFDKKFCK